MSVSSAYVQWKMAQDITPIILTGGIATAVGGSMPILTLTESAGNLQSSASPSAGVFTNDSGSSALSGIDSQLDSFFARFVPVSGSSLISNQVATYPFANQQVAANAIIAQPLNVSMRMYVTARNDVTYPVKFAIMSALQKSLYQHNSIGGLYSVVTPSYIYTNCILTGLRDVSAGETRQPQYVYQFDFTQPLVTLQAATQAQNNLMQTITNGTPISGTPTYATGLPIGNPTNALTQALGPVPM